MAFKVRSLQEVVGQVDLNSPETWRWIWLSAAVVFAVGEIAVAGSFFLPTQSTAMFGALGGIKELFKGLDGAAGAAGG